MTGVPRSWLHIAPSYGATLNETWGERLKRARRMRRLSKLEIAQRTGIATDRITLLEARHTTPVDPVHRDEAVALLGVLQFSLDGFELNG